MNKINSSIIIREIHENDIDSIYDLLNDLSDESKKNFHPHPFDKITIKNIASNSKDHYFVMIFDDKIIGYSFLRLFNSKIPSLGCCVHIDYQKKGYGKILTKWTLKQACFTGYSKVILKVYKTNKIAFNMYKKVGFKTVKNSIKNNEIFMEYICEK